MLLLPWTRKTTGLFLLQKTIKLPFFARHNLDVKLQEFTFAFITRPFRGLRTIHIMCSRQYTDAKLGGGDPVPHPCRLVRTSLQIGTHWSTMPRTLAYSCNLFEIKYDPMTETFFYRISARELSSVARRCFFWVLRAIGHAAPLDL